MKKLLLTFVASYVIISNISAQQRSFEKAEKIAYNWVSKLETPKHKVMSSLRYDVERRSITKAVDDLKKGNAPFYIFADSSSTSFVIVSGDTRMKEILAIGTHLPSERGSAIPEGLADLLDSYRYQYELLQSGAIVPETSSFTIHIPNVPPLLATKWHQRTPFNDLCPRDCPSGCVATAMSQVMNYHQYPESGQGSFSYISSSRSFNCSYDFANATFQWDKLKNTYSSSTLGETPGAKEIAQITYACGVSVGMDYDYDGSGAYLSDVPYALINFFGYNDNVSYRDRNYFNAVEWYESLCQELLEGRPVIYGGVDSKGGGHAFVIEGCNSQTGKFYVNWGWGGDFDGEYELDALDPARFRFSSYQNMIVNASPQTVGNHEDVFYAGKFTASADVAFNKNITFTIHDLYCYSNQSSHVVSKAKFYGEVGIAVFDKDFNYVSTLDSKPVEGLNTFGGYSKLSFTTIFRKSMFPETGTYFIAPYVRATSSVQPTRIRTFGGRTDYVAVVVDEDDITGEEEDSEPVDVVSAWNEDFEYTAVPKGWIQQPELGESLWKHRYVLLPSEDMPLAAKGKGYIYLQDAAVMQGRFNERTVTRLETSVIPLSEEKSYDLSLQYRKYTKLPESTDLITVFYEKGGERHLLSEIPVTSQGEWTKVIMQLPVSGSIKLSFEGSPSKGSAVFLDDLQVYEHQVETDICQPCDQHPIGNMMSIYNLSGMKMTDCSKGHITHEGLTKGIYIMKQHGKFRKLFIKN